MISIDKQPILNEIPQKKIIKIVKSKKNTFIDKDLKMLIHDAFKHCDVNSENYEKEIIESVIILYNQINDPHINIECQESYEKISNMLKERKPIDEPIISSEDIEKNKEIVNYLKTIPQPEQRTPEWYTFRNNRLTASDLATAVNKNPYSNRNKLIMKKCGHEEPWKPGPAIEHGVKYEDVAVMIYELRNDVEVKEFGCIPHHTVSFFGASPDGICDVNSRNENFIGRMLEIKCPKSRPITGFVPEYYLYQVLGQLEVCQLEYCDFLECDIREYKNKEAFFEDSLVLDNTRNINYNKKNMEKGVVIELYDHNLKKMVYRYAKPNISEFELLAWIEQVIDDSLENDKLDYNTTTYWYLEEYCTTLVKRDREWFEKTYVDIEKFWNDVLHYRNVGIESLKNTKEKKTYMKKKKSMSFLQ